MTVRLALAVLLIPALAACSGGLPAADAAPGPGATREPTPAASPSPTGILTPTISSHPRPTAGLTPTPSLTPTPLLAPTDSACAPVAADPELLRLVDREHGLGRDYLPPDLVELELHPRNVYLKPQYLRQIATEPLLALLARMNSAGLRPRMISGYRSYVEQTIAYQQWLKLYPDRGAQISAPPGFSEHQLGTAVDFGAPALEYKFHTDFYKTPEGEWLRDHAAEYGFTLSYPPGATEQTGFQWEPWHYRYVGAPLASMLQAQDLPLAAYLRACAGGD